MKSKSAWHTGSKLTIKLSLIALIASVFLVTPDPLIKASSPSSGAISANSAPLAWSGFTAPVAACESEATCIEGVNCDTYQLDVQGNTSDWVGKLINVNIEWSIQANDFDLYIHKESNEGAIVNKSTNGAPSVREAAAIDPSATGTGRYTIRVVYFSVAADKYQGQALVETKPVSRNANYVKGGISFSANTRTTAPVTRRDGEPSSRTDRFGNYYVAGIRGVPAGTDLWYFDLRPGSATYDPFMRNPIYRGMPDGFAQSTALSVGGDGGGDIDLAVGFDNSGPNSVPNLAAVSLVAANISSSRSQDLGKTFTLNPAGNLTGGQAVDDRQWLEAFGKDIVYLYYRTISVPVVHYIHRSTDGGLTYGPGVFVGLDGQTGYIDVDQNDGTVYASRMVGNNVVVAVGKPDAIAGYPLTYADHVAATDPSGIANIFAPVKVASDGTVYVSYSNGKNIFIAHSTDKGNTWSLPVRVSDGAETRTSLFPWLETGDLPGSVAVVWYGTAEPANSDNADWHVFFAQSLNAKDETPTFRQVIASDHFIHGSNISTGGLLGAANRNLIDYFQVSIDPTGAAVIGYTDDHNDYDGHVYVTRQISGPSLKGGSVPAPVEGRALPARAPVPADAPQVTDFAQDQITGLLAVAPINSPFDILSVKYSCETGADGPVIVAQMKVSDLSVVPLGGNWRVSFTANAPDSRLSPTGDYSFGLSDRGDQFFLRASTETSPTGSFTFGTTVRNPDGSLSYTTRGGADSGSFDQVNRTITMKVSVSKLNPFVTRGPAIGASTTLVGLRGQTFTVGANIVSDITRGGTQFTLGSCQAAPPPPPPPPPTEPNTINKVTGSGSVVSKSVNFAFNADNSLNGHLNYQDKEQGLHMVSSTISSFVQTGKNQVTFSGTGTVGNQPVNFEVTVEDNGEPGSNDFFRIEITGARTSSRSGKLTQGNIQAHK